MLCCYAKFDRMSKLQKGSGMKRACSLKIGNFVQEFNTAPNRNP